MSVYCAAIRYQTLTLTFEALTFWAENWNINRNVYYCGCSGAFSLRRRDRQTDRRTDGLARSVSKPTWHQRQNNFTDTLIDCVVNASPISWKKTDKRTFFLCHFNFCFLCLAFYINICVLYFMRFFHVGLRVCGLFYSLEPMRILLSKTDDWLID